jgi:hypothetical protein
MSNQQESPSYSHDGPSETMGFDWPAVPIYASSLAEMALHNKSELRVKLLSLEH